MKQRNEWDKVCEYFRLYLATVLFGWMQRLVPEHKALIHLAMKPLIEAFVVDSLLEMSPEERKKEIERNL